MAVQHQGIRQARIEERPPPLAKDEHAVVGGQAALPTDRLVDLVRWRRWYRSAQGAHRMASWAERHRALVGWYELDGHGQEFERPISSARTDAMQAALVSLTQDGDAEAAVALVVQLRPGLVGLVRQVGAVRSVSRADAVQEVRSVFFEILAGHSLDRRPSRIAANLVLDTRQRLARGFRPPPAPIELVATPPLRDHADVDRFTSVLAYETLQAAAEKLPGSAASQRLTADLGFRAWVLGEPRSDIARDLDLGPENVRSRLHRFRSAIRSDYDQHFEYRRAG